MPILHWVGKEKVIKHHQEVSFKVMKHCYGFSQEEGEKQEATRSGNKIIHGDNLETLKALIPEYEGKIKCIYIDPPYNTGNEHWVYNDNVNHPNLKKWFDKVVGKEGEDLTRHDKWLCMMYPRLKLLHKLLHPEGSIFISLDEIETKYLRLMMNEIFGEINFVAQITLLCNPKGRSQDKHFSTNHEYITIYSKTPRPKDFYSITKDDSLIEKEYKHKDEQGSYRLLELRNTHREFNKENRPNLFYPLYVNANTSHVSLQQNEDFSIEVKPLWPDGYEGCWTWSKELVMEENHLLTAQKIKGQWKIYRKSYSTSENGTVKRKLFTIWNDSKFYTEKGQATFGEIFPGLNKNDFPQPKSVDLVMDILQTCTSGEDIILDSFAGSGTTAHAVLKLNQQDGGNRKFILIEQENYIYSITTERIKKVSQGYSKEEPLKGDFDFYQLGESLFDGENNEFLNNAVDTELIREYIWYSETRMPYKAANGEDIPYFLGNKEGTSYYFISEKGKPSTLDYDTLSIIHKKAEQYIIYADNCRLPKDLMMQHRIIFKKSPRDITRF